MTPGPGPLPLVSFPLDRDPIIGRCKGTQLLIPILFVQAELGDATVRQGDDAQAERAYRRSRTLLDQLPDPDPREQGSLCGNLASVL
jgi:hypothetical protein